MTALIVFLWIANMLVDTGGQLFFKAAASEHTAGAGGLAHWKRMASRPWLWFGICCYVLEFFVWMAFLSQVELSVGVMLGCNVGTTMTLRWPAAPAAKFLRST